MLENVNSVLSGLIMPALLVFAGIYFAVKLRFFFILHPLRLARDIKNASGSGKTSPAKALTMALAGTLGVGNISGVASAVTAGGAGAVFWMIASAFAAMSVKYAEVYLSVRYRRTKNGEYTGGAPYYMRDGIPASLGKGRGSVKFAYAVSCVFSAGLIANSLMTGNIVQVNAAASVFPSVPPVVTGIVIAVLSLAVIVRSSQKIFDLTYRLIPLLAGVYIAVSMYIILTNMPRVPSVISRIISEAFDFRSAAGGVLGFTVSRSVRFGVTRGLFSNEAGCGTAVTAHAAADTKSPHHQGCYGIFEVFADTVILCTMTALVILLAGGETLYDGIPLSLYSYEFFTGALIRAVIGASVILFAYATVICQAYYGLQAVAFLTPSRLARRIYIAAVGLCSVCGAVISSSVMWSMADFVISAMTVMNVVCLLMMRREIVYKTDRKSEKNIDKGSEFWYNNKNRRRVSR